jgi:hypothetical protein
MMKKLLVLMLVLATASAASAGIYISVDGVVDPPESQVTLVISEHAVIDIWGDDVGGVPGAGTYLFGMRAGPGVLDLDDPMAQITYGGNKTSKAVYHDATEDDGLAAMLGIVYPWMAVDLTDLVTPPDVPLPLLGKLVDLIDFHCIDEGDVTLVLMDGDGNVLDTQVIHQIPEPATIALLGLGGLALLRRRR